MATRAVVAFAAENDRRAFSELLEKNGIKVRHICRTGLETIRAVKKMGGGVVICGCKLPDMTADQLCGDLEDIASFLVIGKPGQLELCESEEIFRLATPVRGGELTGSVNMLLQLDQRRSRALRPQRTDEDKELISRAKEAVMEKNGLTEDAAYRFIQRSSMDSGLPMTEVARTILYELD